MKNRRSFIKNTTLAGASLPLFNIGVAGASPNEKINHASFGANGMAFSDIRSLTRGGLVNLVAVAEVLPQVIHLSLLCHQDHHVKLM